MGGEWNSAIEELYKPVITGKYINRLFVEIFHKLMYEYRI
jgi:hypothetical protein